MNIPQSKTYDADADATVFYGALVFFLLSVSLKLPTHLFRNISN